MENVAIRPAETTVHSFLRGLPWVIAIPVCAFICWWIWHGILPVFMPANMVGFASIGISTMAAYVLCLIALAGYWPLQGIENIWSRGIAMIIIAILTAAIFFIVLYSIFGVDLEAWTFPIVANSWLVLAATSFVGGDLHLNQIPPVRRMFLNLLISTGMTILLMRTITIFPAYWFPFLQATIITGGLGYIFRKTTQPTFSILVWSLLMLLMFIFLAVATGCGFYSLFSPAPQFWTWNIGTATPEFGLFFATTCGMNMAVLGCTQSWPFSRVRQPFGTCLALLSMLCWCLILAWIFAAIFKGISTEGQHLWEAQVMAWHTVFWGFAWVYCFGIGQTPYLWKGQKTPGTWDDVD